jgi:murein L,D-transpeptidase YcbB/YkuD
VNVKDSANVKSLLTKRLKDVDTTLHSISEPDSMQVASAIRRYQIRKRLKPDGKFSVSLASSLNESDKEKFIRLAITLDRYKQMPALPGQYIWVNIPAYQLTVWEDSIPVLTSKVVVGKPYTRTPILTSAISDMITYPLWHIPNSIIAKEILPNLKKDPGYLSKKGYSLVDGKGNQIDPYLIDWSQHEKTIPFRVIQGSGDDNALGVLKFNFPNKYSVYLHDTNQRYLFANRKRALSHGCVRVQEWDKLARYILNQDGMINTRSVPVDSMMTWLALKEKHVIPLRKRIPLYIRYFTCEAKDNNLVMHEDIYGEDRKLRDKYFANK